MNGIINVYKEKDMTSHDCVAIIRRASGIKRVGHTGTLDPMATGVLPICIGRSTRIMDYTDLDEKVYDVEMLLGIETDTLDIWGSVVQKKEVPKFSDEKVLSSINSFVGEVTQKPPKYSALKVNGKKLYEYAREGKEVEIKSRIVTIHSISNIIIDIPHISFTVSCSKGTYIRSLCNDIGLKLNNLGIMTGLTRTKSGVFTIQNTINIMKLKEMEKEDIEKIILPPEYPLVNFGVISLNDKYMKDYMNGKSININVIDEIKEGIDNRYKVFGDNDFVGVGVVRDDILRVDKMLY